MTLVCRDLHWLPVSARVDYKILVLTYKALHGLAPQYLSCLLQWYQPGRALRSVHSGQLSVPRTKLCTYGDRAFFHAAPVLWNSLPPGTRGAESLAVFKKKLKTFFYSVNHFKETAFYRYFSGVNFYVCSAFECFSQIHGAI